MTAGVLRFKVVPAQTGLLLEAVGVGGMGLTVMVTVPGDDAHPFTVAVTK
jgi:hypothetical protein